MTDTEGNGLEDASLIFVAFDLLLRVALFISLNAFHESSIEYIMTIAFMKDTNLEASCRTEFLQRRVDYCLRNRQR